jgi:hypothetical protein
MYLLITPIRASSTDNTAAKVSTLNKSTDNLSSCGSFLFFFLLEGQIKPPTLLYYQMNFTKLLKLLLQGFSSTETCSTLYQGATTKYSTAMSFE